MPQTLKQTTATALFWSFTERVSIQVIQIILGIVLARLLFPSDFGLIGMLTIFTAISTLFIDSGFTSALIQKQDRTDVDFSTAFYFNILISIVCYAILYMSAPFISTFYNAPVLIPIIRVLFLSLIINSLCSIQNTQLTILLDFKKKAIVGLVAVLVGGGVGVYMAYEGYGVWALVCQTLISSLVTLALLNLLVRWTPGLVFSKASLKQLFGFGSKLLGVGIIDTIMNNLYTILIGRYFSSVQVGYYTRGMQMPTAVSNMFSSVIQNVTYPVLSSVQNDKERLTSIYRRLIITTGFWIIPAMTGLAILSKPFVLYFLTEKWTPAIVLMQWICFARIFTPLSSLNLNILNAVGRPDLFLKIDLVKLPMAIIALVITVPLGLKAVVVGHCITSFVAFFVNAYLPGKMFGYGAIDQLKDLLPVLLCTALMSSAMLLVPQFIESYLLIMVVSIILGAGVYFLTAFLLKMQELEELKLILTKIWKIK